MASLGSGAVAGALMIAATGGGRDRGMVFRVASFAFPVLLLLFGLVHTPLVNARLQELVPDALRGRVLSLYVMVYVGGSPIGSFVGGWVARAYGVDWAIGGGAVLMLCFALWAFREHPGLSAR